jgi:hypothetical protein
MQSVVAREGVLTAAIDTGGTFETVNATLYNAPVAENPFLTLADLTPLAATFTGGGPLVITWSAIALSGANQPFVESQLLLWICTADPVSPEDIYGVYYDDGTDFLGLDPFDQAARISRAGDSVQWICTLP